MAIKEHPGWKEFPLETGQAVRADQLNALWWALSERGAVGNISPIEDEFGIFEDGDFVRYRGGDRARLIKSAGESKLLAIGHLNRLKIQLLSVLSVYVDPDESLVDAPLVGNRWTLSDILKKLSIGGPVDTPDSDFNFTIIPDRPGEVIGKDPNGADVLFNDFFGPAKFGPVVPIDTPTFKEHLNEVYFIIKKLTHIPINTLGLIADDRAIINTQIRGTLDGASFDRSAEFDVFQTSWLNDRFALISDVVFGVGTISQGVGIDSALRYSFQTATGPADKIQILYAYSVINKVIRANIPFPLFPGEIGENNDLPNPYVYGEKKIAIKVGEKFTEVTSLGQVYSASEPSFANGIIRAITPSETVTPTQISDFNQGELVLEFDIETQKSEGDPTNQFTEEINLDNIEDMLPKAEADDIDAAQLDFNVYVGEDFGGDATEAGPPNDISVPGSTVSAIIRREADIVLIQGFFEITNWTHKDRERDPLPPNVPSGLESV